MASHAQVPQEWLMSPEVHRRVTGGEIVKMCHARRENDYAPLERSTGEGLPESFIQKCAYQKTQSPANHHPKEGDWSCRYCNRFNFWDHHTCAGCSRSKQLLEAGQGPVKEAVVGYYSQLMELGLASAEDVRQLQMAPKIPLISPEQLQKMNEQIAPASPFDNAGGGGAPGGGGGGKGGAVPRYAGVGASSAPAAASSGPVDPLLAYRAEKLKQKSQGIKEYKMMQAGGGGGWRGR